MSFERAFATLRELFDAIKPNEGYTPTGLEDKLAQAGLARYAQQAIKQAEEQGQLKRLHLSADLTVDSACGISLYDDAPLVTALVATDLLWQQPPAQPLDSIADYGEHYERDKWLFANREKLTLKQLAAELKRIGRKKKWRIIGERQIRDAVKTYAAFVGEPVPKGLVGRPAKT